jgi:hypothetical protein
MAGSASCGTIFREDRGTFDMEIRVLCIKGWNDDIAPDRIVVQVGWHRWLLNVAGRCYMTPGQEKARNAGLTP